MKQPLACAVFISLIALTTASAQVPAVLIFGGSDHKEFLGCLSCSATDLSSVWNEISKYGWGNGFGVWNSFGSYKNPFGAQSACNEYGNDPPVLVDNTGQFYGYLTLNAYKNGSVCSPSGSERVCQALKVMCATS